VAARWEVFCPCRSRVECRGGDLGRGAATGQGHSSAPAGRFSSRYGAVAGGLFGLLLCCPPPQLPELPAQEKEGLVSSGAVREFEQPTRLSARSAPRGIRVRMASSPTLVRWNGFPASASVRPPPGDACPWPSGLLSIGGRPEIRGGTEVVKSGTESPAPAVYGVVQCSNCGLRRPARWRAARAHRRALGGDGLPSTPLGLKLRNETKAVV
jgi:hypothetical protein